MGYAAHSVENLGAPFLLMDEMMFVIPKSSTMSLGKHHFKVLFVLSGSIDHEIDGLHGRQTLDAGDILVAPVVTRHEYINPDRRDAASVQLIRIFLDADHLQACARRRVRRPEADFSDFLLHHLNRVACLRGGVDSEVTRLIERFRSETDRRPFGYRHHVRSICTELLISVARKLHQGGSGESLTDGSNASQIVAAANEYLLKHFATKLTLGDVAWHVRKGEEHLARVYKRQTGQSVFDYVRELRIHHARTLLQDASISLTDIAEQCGFQSLSFFSRTFREQVGISPSRYRGHVRSTSTPERGIAPKTRRNA